MGQVRLCPEVILIEGLFDYAALWQAGFCNVTCSMGANLNARQFRQLGDGPRTVYLAFDADRNGSGQQATLSLACRLSEEGVKAYAQHQQMAKPPPLHSGCGLKRVLNTVPDAVISSISADERSDCASR